MKSALISILVFLTLDMDLRPVPVLNGWEGSLIQQSEELFAKIVTEKKDKIINIKAIFYNLSDSSFYLSYKMKTVKKGNSGSSESKQSGKFHSLPKSELKLAEVGLDVDKYASYEINLRVFNKGNLISVDSISLIMNH